MLKKAQRANSANPPQALSCSFCHKAQEHVRELIAGPSVFICGECVQVCNEILADNARVLRRGEGATVAAAVKDGAEPQQLPEVPISGPAVRCALCRLPTPLADGILIPNRGVLCPGCIGAVEVTVAERRQADL